jgi:hypothetical protein
VRYIDYDYVKRISCICWLCYTKSSPLNWCVTLNSVNGVTVADQKYLMLETFIVHFDAQQFVQSILCKIVGLRYCGLLRCLLQLCLQTGFEIYIPNFCLQYRDCVLWLASWYLSREQDLVWPNLWRIDRLVLIYMRAGLNDMHMWFIGSPDFFYVLSYSECHCMWKLSLLLTRLCIWWDVKLQLRTF